MPVEISHGGGGSGMCSTVVREILFLGEVFLFMKQTFPFPRLVNCATATSERGKETVGRSALSRIQILVQRDSVKNLATLSNQFAVGTHRRWEFCKRSQLFICPHNEPLPVIAMCVNNPECSPAGIYRCNTAPTPTGFAEIVSGYFLVLRSPCRMPRARKIVISAFVPH